MSGLVLLTSGMTSAEIQSALNQMDTEQYGEVALTFLTVANLTARNALPSYYLVDGKVVYVLDSDGAGTPQFYQYDLDTTTWAVCTAINKAIDSGTGALYPKHVTTVQRTAITSPEGIMVYDTDLHKLFVRGASAWEQVTSV